MPSCREKKPIACGPGQSAESERSTCLILLPSMQGDTWPLVHEGCCAHRMSLGHQHVLAAMHASRCLTDSNWAHIAG